MNSDKQKLNLLERIQAFLLNKTNDESESTELDQVELESQTLKDGTVIEYQAWEAGSAVFVKPTEEGQDAVPLPVGNYELENGQILVVEEDGIIARVEDASAEEESTDDETEMNAEERIAELEAENASLRELLNEAKTALSVESAETENETENDTDESVELSAETENETEDVTSKRQVEKQKPLYNLSRKVNSTTARVYAIINQK